MKVLVTGARLPAALEVARALKKVGCELWLADSVRFAPGAFSKCSSGYFQFPSPAFQFEKFQSRMKEVCERQKFDYIIPISEEIFYLSAIQSDLAGAKLFSPPLTILRKLHSKWQIQAMAQDCNVKLPRTQKLCDRNDLFLALKTFSNLVLKAEFSRGAFGTLFNPNPEEVSLIQPSEQNAWLAQEHISGREVSTYSIANEGRLFAHTAYLPKYRSGFGASLYFDPIEFDSAHSFVASFVKKHHLSGQFAFDFIETKEKDLFLLECNPRATSGVHLLTPESHWGKAFIGEIPNEQDSRKRPQAAKAGVLSLYAVKALREHSIASLLSDLRKAQDTSFAIDDPLPFFAQILSGFEILLRSLYWKVSISRAYTYDLEWDGRSPK